MGSWNIGNLTSRFLELVDIMQKRKITFYAYKRQDRLKIRPK